MCSNLTFVSFISEFVSLSYEKIDLENDSNLNNKCAGIFNTFFGIGFAVAPNVSGFLIDFRSFQFACSMMAAMNVFLALVFFVYFIVFKRCYKKNDKEIEKEKLDKLF